MTNWALHTYGDAMVFQGGFTAVICWLLVANTMRSFNEATFRLPFSLGC
eukprot:COSAG01_NODE_3386_length_6153_cov_89.762471_4_plen_49_part_00